MTAPILNTHNKEEYAPAHTAEHLQSMTYEEYLKQQQQAIDEEQSDDSCFLTEQPEGQFVRGH